MVESIVMWLKALIEAIGYGGIGLSMFIESFFAPIPSELIMPFAGFLAADGHFNVRIAILVGTLGAYLGTLPFYFIGYRGNRAKINAFVQKYGKYLFIDHEDVDKGFELFARFGYRFVFFGRLIPIVRTFVSFPAGAVRMDFFKFSLLSILGSLVRTAFLTLMGYKLGENRERIGGIMTEYEGVIKVVVIVCIVVYICRKLYQWYMKKQNQKKTLEK